MRGVVEIARANVENDSVVNYVLVAKYETDYRYWVEKKRTGKWKTEGF